MIATIRFSLWVKEDARNVTMYFDDVDLSTFRYESFITKDCEFSFKKVDDNKLVTQQFTLIAPVVIAMMILPNHDRITEDRETEVIER